ncbi:MAG: 3-keto-disaccharide hydrolase [Verrucomicrobiota bacterium]
MRIFQSALVGLFVVSSLPISAAPAPANLFNGKDLSGWVQHGGKAKYKIEGDAIVGTSTLDTPNSFLCTEKTYGDFVLEYDFKVDERLNSGVQIRSECFEQPTKVQLNGKTFSFPADRVHGYQVEIDPDPKKNRWWSAGIYDEGRRGWLFPAGGEKSPQGIAFTEQGRKIFKQGDWNHVRVEAIGDSIKTWLNGTPCASITDSVTPRGFIALQVHAIGKEKEKAGSQVRWRNLQITDLSNAQAMNTLSDREKSEGWRLLWDGKTTDGWRSARAETFPTKGWSIHDGVLTVHENNGAEAVDGGDIITRERFSNFELLVDFKITPGANSGIKYFVQPSLAAVTGTGAKAAVGSAIGCEFQILDDLRHPDAKLGRNGNRTIGSLYDLIPAAASKKPNPIGEWNTARIVVQGGHVEHWLNGAKVVEYDRHSDAFRKLVAESKYRNIPNFGEWADGHILLQEHGNEVWFRNVKIRVLPAK